MIKIRTHAGRWWYKIQTTISTAKCWWDQMETSGRKQVSSTNCEIPPPSFREKLKSSKYTVLMFFKRKWPSGSKLLHLEILHNPLQEVKKKKKVKYIQNISSSSMSFVSWHFKIPLSNHWFLNEGDLKIYTRRVHLCCGMLLRNRARQV